jgi:hypothetical protein
VGDRLAFDAIEKRKKKEAPRRRQDKKALNELTQITRVYPVIGYTDEGYVKTRVLGFIEGFFEILKVKQYDLYIFDDEQIDFVTMGQWDLNKLYPAPLKEIYLNFPEENQEQQAYFKYKIDQTDDPQKLKVLQMEIEKDQYIEQHYRLRHVYLYVFGSTVAELTGRLHDLERFKDYLGQEQLSLDKKKKVLQSINNQL